MNHVSSTLHQDIDGPANRGPSLRISSRWFLSGAAALAVLAGGLVGYRAAACEPEKSGQQSLFVDKPLSGHSQVHVTTNDENDSDDSTFTFVKVEDDHKVHVIVKDGEVTKAEIDGETIPADRIRHKEGSVELLDAGGKVLAKIDTSMASHDASGHKATAIARSRGAWGGGAGAGAGAGGSTPYAFSMQMADPPPVMVGITMNDAEEGDDGVTIDTVMDGLPASKAGLKPGDRVVAMDGKEVKNPKEFREVIRSKKPGETLKIKVDRDGDSKEFDIKLEAYDAQRLGQRTSTWWQTPQGTLKMLGHRDDKWYDEAIAAIAKAMDEVRSSDALNSKKFKEQATAALEKAKTALEEAKAKVSAEMETLMAQRNGMMLWSPNSREPLRVPTPPVAPLAPNSPSPPIARLAPLSGDDAAIAHSMDRLSTLVERLNSRLDKLEKRLDEREKKDR